MLGEDRHSKSMRCYQSYLMLVLVISVVLQVITFVTEIGFQLSAIGATPVPDHHSWHLYYLLAIIVLFLLSLPLTIIGIKGTTNEGLKSVLTFAFGILLTFGVKTIVYIVFSDYRLAVLLAINLIVNSIAFVFALVFTRKMMDRLKDEPLSDSLQGLH